MSWWPQSLVVVIALGGCATAGGSDEADAAAPIDGAPQADAPLLPDARVAPPCVEGDLQMQDPETGHCYIYVDNNTNWTAARAICEAFGSDVFLASITSVEENTFIDNLIPDQEVWIGGNDLVNEMEFVWISGEPFVYENWRSGEPNGNGEDCITFQGQLAGVWDDRPCGDNQRVVCERD